MIASCERLLFSNVTILFNFMYYINCYINSKHKIKETTDFVNFRRFILPQRCYQREVISNHRMHGKDTEGFLDGI